MGRNKLYGVKNKSIRVDAVSLDLFEYACEAIGVDPSVKASEMMRRFGLSKISDLEKETIERQLVDEYRNEG